ncbi:MAG: hypothetical protein HOP33_04895 [Verrucomicrobia bacterium]|nr:hypothetical protein [Verrucomicrobiota bacterium]
MNRTKLLGGITVPVSGSVRFYRIIVGTAFTITSITISGGNVVITCFYDNK